MLEQRRGPLRSPGKFRGGSCQLREKKAWWESNKRLVEDLRKGKNKVAFEEAEEEVDDITSKLRDLVIGELRSVWDRLRQVEKSKMPRGPEFTEEEIPLPYTQDLLNARVMGDSKAPKVPLYDGMTDPYDHLDNFHYAIVIGLTLTLINYIGCNKIEGESVFFKCLWRNLYYSEGCSSSSSNPVCCPRTHFQVQIQKDVFISSLV